MMTPRGAFQQINQILGHLAEIGLTNDQQFAIFRQNRQMEVTFKNADLVLRAMKKTPYAEIYDDFVRHRVFSAKMIDGTLIQMAYAFRGYDLVKHRLAFLASPYSRRVEDDPEFYLDDEQYAEILERDVEPVILRFDYNREDSQHRDLLHPKSHLTLGGYNHCRIPVISPLTPFHFMTFILRNFYGSSARDVAESLPRFRDTLPRSITDLEQTVLHIVVPS